MLYLCTLPWLTVAIVRRRRRFPIPSSTCLCGPGGTTVSSLTYTHWPGGNPARASMARAARSATRTTAACARAAAPAVPGFVSARASPADCDHRGGAGCHGQGRSQPGGASRQQEPGPGRVAAVARPGRAHGPRRRGASGPRPVPAVLMVLGADRPQQRVLRPGRDGPGRDLVSQPGFRSISFMPGPSFPRQRTSFPGGPGAPGLVVLLAGPTGRHRPARRGSWREPGSASTFSSSTGTFSASAACS